MVEKGKKNMKKIIAIVCVAMAAVAPGVMKKAAAARQTPVARKSAPAARQATSAWRAAATIHFTSLDVVAETVRQLGSGSGDVILTKAVPFAIRNSWAVRLFGAMPRGTTAVAVCYVNEAELAKFVANAAQYTDPKRRDAVLDRAKSWAVMYPLSMGKAAFLAKHPEAKQVGGTYFIKNGSDPIYVAFSADGKWAAAAAAASLARATFTAAAQAFTRPLGSNLCRIACDRAGAQALFQSQEFAGGTIDIRMGVAGLEITGAAAVRSATPPASFNFDPSIFAAVPGTVYLYGATTSGNDAGPVADLFNVLSPNAAFFVKKSLVFQPPRSGANPYMLNIIRRDKQNRIIANGKPVQRIAAILPEACTRPHLDNLLYCSPANVLKLCLPRIAQTLPTGPALKCRIGATLISNANGTGMGFMSWREGAIEHFFIRISKDELRATAPLWSAALI